MTKALVNSVEVTGPHGEVYGFLKENKAAILELFRKSSSPSQSSAEIHTEENMQTLLIRCMFVSIAEALRKREPALKDRVQDEYTPFLEYHLRSHLA